MYTKNKGQCYFEKIVYKTCHFSYTRPLVYTRKNRNDLKMKLLKIVPVGLILVLGSTTNTQTDSIKSEIGQITETLILYIEGTANGQPDRLRKVFHPDFNLYTVTTEDSLRIRSGEKYISNVKEDEKSNRIGRIISIDYEKDAAIAKAEIVIPNWKIFTDYFLLLKYEGSWKIVHKSYTWRA